MTVICDKCGCENHLNRVACKECGYPIKNDIEYVVCSICGLSNPKTAKKCIGCAESLNDHTSFVVQENEPAIIEDEAALSVESSVVYKPEVSLKKKSRLPKKWRTYLVLILSSCALFVLLLSLLFWIFGNKQYIDRAEGFYYINQSNELHIINEKQDDILIATGVESISKFVAYGKNFYFLSEGILYHYKKSLTEIDKSVNSFKVNLDGERVLYTIEVDDVSLGDLYLYADEISTRIDAKVGVDRYLFGHQKNDVYYVTEITDEENLGILYKKELDGSIQKIADDVYQPILSLKKDSVYFVRSDIHSGDKFELYYTKDKRVTEIGRNIQHIFLEPKSEEIIIIQEKNDAYNLFYNKRENVKELDSEIERFGEFEFGDVYDPILYRKDIDLIYKKVNGDLYYLNHDKYSKINESFEEFWLSADKSSIMTLINEEIQQSKFKKGKLSDSISLATKAIFVDMSETGEAVLLEQGDDYILTRKSKERSLDMSDAQTIFSDNEKYLIYFDGSDAYSLKLTASSPAYIGEFIIDAKLIGKYVYTFTDTSFYRYKLGKYSSTKEIDVYKAWSIFDKTY